MKIIIPYGIEAEASIVDGSHKRCRLRFALGDEDDRPPPRCTAGAAADLGNDVARRPIMDSLRCVEA
jgi:hypothetical protein